MKLTSVSAAAVYLYLTSSASFAVDHILEEIIVNAQKRPQSLLDIPISITIVGDEQLSSQNINGVIDLAGGAVPPLKISTLGSSQSTLVVGMRGVSPADPSQITIEGSVGWYLDDIYLNRSQSLAVDLVDIERIEVLAGPQGTLFGRNNIGGAVRLVSKKPTGELGFNQDVKWGKYNELRTNTNIMLPEIAGIKGKIDYVHSERDGWIDNTSPTSDFDYTQFDKDGLRVSVSTVVSEKIELFYAFDSSKSETVHYYHQFYRDVIGLFGEERSRLSQTRNPVPALEPTKTDQSGHMVKLSWQISDNLLLKSLTSYRDLIVNEHTNFAGVLYFNGLDLVSDIHQHQWSQEIQLIGSNDTVDWVAGLYHFDENVDKTLQQTFTFDIFGIFGPPLSPITPTTFDALSLGTNVPPRVVELDNKSSAVFAQVEWSPEAFQNRLHFIAGLRHSDDNKSGSRLQFEATPEPMDTGSNNTDYTLAVTADINDHVNTYLKYSTGYKAAGANTQSDNFSTFDEETVKTFEFGAKVQHERFRMSAALFQSTYQDMQINISNPNNITAVETINAVKYVSVDGLELSTTVLAFSNLTIGFNYTYLDGDFPLQPDPFRSSQLAQFFVSQAPTHSASLTADYQRPINFGKLTIHLGATSTDTYSYVPFSDSRLDAYTLFNTSIGISDISAGDGQLSISLWGKNLTDEEYVVYSFPVGDPAIAVAQAFGDPLTFGANINYRY